MEPKLNPKRCVAHHCTWTVLATVVISSCSTAVRDSPAATADAPDRRGAASTEFVPVQGRLSAPSRSGAGRLNLPRLGNSPDSNRLDSTLAAHLPTVWRNVVYCLL
jgi:hypothetical protein